MMWSNPSPGDPVPSTVKSAGVKRYGLALAALWALAIAISAAWNRHDEWAEAHEFATEAARTNYYKDIVYCSWNAGHGGVYVPITETTQPNPYVEVEEREIETPSGRRLTMVNPAYMTRQVRELELEAEGVRGHITSLSPIRPANAPDAWERTALEAFERGETEVVSVETLDGAPHLRLMRPFV